MIAVAQNDDRSARLLQAIEARTGLLPSAGRADEFEAAIRRAMQRARISDAETFARHLDSDETAFDALVDELTIGETYFLREPAQFDALRGQVLPDLDRTRCGRRLRVWSAGCASGEEAYSLAIVLEQEGFADRAPILGSDLCRRALDRAREAAYGAWSLRGLPADFAARYFHRRGDRFLLADRFRRRVEFAFINLASYASGAFEADLIFCRNVLIYFQPTLVERVARELYATLADGGWLISGPSDPPLWDHAPFETIVTAGGVFYRRPDPAMPARRRHMTRAAVPVVAEPERAAARPIAPLRLPAPYDDPPQPPRETITLARVADGRAGHVRALMNGGQPDDAERAASAAIAAHPLDPELRYLHAMILIDRGRPDEAEIALKGLVYLDRSLAVAHFALGALLVRRGALADARRCYRTVAALCGELSPDAAVRFGDGESARRLCAAAGQSLALIAQKEADR